MNDFGTPMGDAEINMLPPGSIKPHEELMAQSGVEMDIRLDFWNNGARAAADAAQAQNEAVQRQFNYNMDLYDMANEKIRQEREDVIASIESQAINEGRVAEHQDALNIRQYNYQMQIRNREQESLNQQFLKSEDIYSRQLGFNAASAEQARNNEYRRYQEIQAEAAFDIQEQRLEQLRLEGQFRAKGVSGRSAAKAQQITGADMGRMLAQINEATSSAGRNTKAVLQEIAQDKLAADLSADAQKMLHPGTLLEPLAPIQTPLTDYIYPRELQDFDFGPEPVLGATVSVNAAYANAQWNTIMGFAGMAATLAGGYMAAGSSKKLKDNIVKVGKSNDGHNIYNFNYKGDNRRFVGVIAEEILEQKPEAVRTMPNGHLGVIYDLIDVDFKEVF